MPRNKGGVRSGYVFTGREMNRLTALGFDLWNTGGGCTAFVREGVDGQIWLTQPDSPHAPDGMDDAVVVGFYAAPYEAALGEVLFPSVREALRRLHLTDPISAERGR